MAAKRPDAASFDDLTSGQLLRIIKKPKREKSCSFLGTVELQDIASVAHASLANIKTK